MSADRRRRAIVAALACAGCGLAGAAIAQDAESPDMDFLLYLGSWEESDEEWTMFEEAAEDRQTRTEPEEPAAEDDETEDDKD
ncbi:MAG: hypothetical protein R3315_05395 [Woeseiaceae bacterium]|nr:hypothetical protein [Woeseiaceae bacterium]